MSSYYQPEPAMVMTNFFLEWKYCRQIKTWRIKPTASPSDIVPPTWRNNHIHQLHSLVLMVSPIFDKSDVKPSWWGIAALSLWRGHLYPRQIAWKPEEGKLSKINVIKKNSQKALCHFEMLTFNRPRQIMPNPCQIDCDKVSASGATFVPKTSEFFPLKIF